MSGVKCPRCNIFMDREECIDGYILYCSECYYNVTVDEEEYLKLEQIGLRTLHKDDY